MRIEVRSAGFTAIDAASRRLGRAVDRSLDRTLD